MREPEGVSEIRLDTGELIGHTLMEGRDGRHVARVRFLPEFLHLLGVEDA